MINRNLIIGICLVLGIWCLEFPSHGATWLDPSLKWKTLETPHFSIHYYTELEDIAKRFAPIAEDVHKTMTKVFKYKLDRKTQVTLLDTTDYGNGFTTVFPYPAITLYLTDLASNLNPYKYDDYLRYLFLHEYTHALHLDIAEGGPSLFRAIFGRMLFPNAMEPWFMIEGIATYMETHYTNAGRGRDPRWEMMMRMDVLEDNMKSIDQAAVDTVKWPMGHLRYLYGVMFLEYLSDKYGEQKLINFAHQYGDFLLSIGVDAAFYYSFGENLSQLWGDWQDYLQDKYQKQKESLGKLTEPQLLTRDGYYNAKPKWSKDSRWIYYIQRNADEYPQIRRVEAASGQSEKILEAMVFDENMSFSPDGKSLLYSKADIYKNYYTYKDLYLMDLQSRRSVRLTEGVRASDPNFSPDGKRIVFVKNEKGVKSLTFAEIGKTETKPLGSKDEGNTQYFSPSFSPDGKYLAAAKYSPGVGQHIALIDPATNEEKSLIFEGSGTTEANPVFSPDGKYILYDSDRNGIVNLYAFELGAGKVYQVTNVIGGAMMPDISPDGKRIAYVSYSSNGFDIAVMDFNPSEWKEIGSPVTVTKPVSKFEDRETVYTNIHDYDPLPTLFPTFWIPYSYSNENGDRTLIYTGGMDPLQQHLYYLNFGYDFEGNKPSYMLYYANNQFLPQISLSLADLSVPYDWSGRTYWERQREGSFAFSFLDNRVFAEYDRQVLSAGFRVMNLTSISTIENYFPRPNVGNLNSIFLSWNYLSSRSYPYSISPEDGLDLGGMVEMNLPDLKSDYNFTSYSASLRHYFRSPFQHQVLASALKGFYSRGDQLEQSNFTWRYLTLRGYPDTLFRGNKGLSLSLEYRFPLWYPEKALLYGYTFFDRVWADLFYDLGGATFDPLDKLTYKRGIGGELNLDTSSLWGSVPLTLKLVYAKGLDVGGVEKFYFTLGL